VKYLIFLLTCCSKFCSYWLLLLWR